MNRSLKIKVCGLRYPENVEAVCELEPEFVGYIFYPFSKRFVGEKPDPAIFMISNPGIGKVGVFVNEEISRVKQIYSLYQLDLVQLHGTESPRYCQELKEEGILIIKALKPMAGRVERSMEAYKNDVHYLLFDTPGREHGGTGRKFDWELLNTISVPLPYLIGGGIGPEDGDAFRKHGFNALFGIDVNSRFELSPGMKDINLLKKFMNEIRT